MILENTFGQKWYTNIKVNGHTMQKKGNDLSLIEALILFSNTLSSEVFKDGKISITEILNGIKNFSYNGFINDKNTIHHYSLNINYSQTSYIDSDLKNNETRNFDIFVKETPNGLIVTVNNIAKDKNHLIELIKKEMKINGNSCNLNHLDVSHITDMSNLFGQKRNDIFQFNGNISSWDVSNVDDMTKMFVRSKFNKDISKWKPYQLVDMDYMFDEHAVSVPYWIKYKNKDERKKAINAYYLSHKLNNELNNTQYKLPKIKI